MGHLPSWGGVSAIVWMYHLDADETHREKAYWELHKNSKCYFDKILEATLYKAAAVRSLTSYLTIRIKRFSHARHCWRRKDTLISGVVSWTPPTHDRVSVGWPAKIYMNEFCGDTGPSLDQPGVMADRDWRQEIHSIRSTWWWWWWWWNQLGFFFKVH